MKIKEEKIINFAIIKVKPTLNNIFITLTDLDGNVLISKHAGLLEFKGSKKRTPYVAGLILKNLIEEIQSLNLIIKTFKLQVKGYIRSGAINNIVKQLADLNINNVIYIEYIMKKAHNGLRLKKARRL